MAFELVIIVCIGLAAAGILMAVTRPFGLKLGKTVAPAVAAIAMLTYQIWSHYTWADRIAAGLRDGAVVLDKGVKAAWFDPWSYFIPMYGTLLVLDTQSTLTHPQHPNLRVVTTQLFELGQTTLDLQQFLDCDTGRRALAASAGPDGLPPEGAWISGREPAALFDAACKP
jgi:hypothetical protein